MSFRSPLWAPRELDRSALGKLQAAKGLDYWSLHKWSIEHPGEFWSLAWDQLNLIGDKGATSYQSGPDFITSKFFPNAKINEIGRAHV